GGITENLNRALPDNFDAQVELGSWEVPAVAYHVCKAARLDEAEALKTFNMGLGMIAVVDATCADAVAASLAEEGERVFRVGSVAKGAGEVAYTNPGALFGFFRPEEPGADAVEAPQKTVDRVLLQEFDDNEEDVREGDAK
ncbi:MAG: AIR synthase-related protein, partial [Eggerthellaceae bacterium]|nr:AIR synthase-related protein [Eggerthellaceae bacterium]